MAVWVFVLSFVEWKIFSWVMYLCLLSFLMAWPDVLGSKRIGEENVFHNLSL